VPPSWKRRLPVKFGQPGESTAPPSTATSLYCAAAEAIVVVVADATLRSNPQLFCGPGAALEVHAAVVVPRPSRDPGGGSQVTPPHEPLIPGAAYATDAAQAPGSLGRTTLSGQAMAQASRQHAVNDVVMFSRHDSRRPWISAGSPYSPYPIAYSRQ